MTTDILEQPPEGPKRRLGFYIAVFLEVGLLLSLAYYNNVIGFIIFCCYFWFTALFTLIEESLSV